MTQVPSRQPHISAHETSSPSTPPAPIYELLNVMARLRRKEGGCPWDLKQNFETIAPHTIEEAYEVVDAISRQDMRGLKAELGDLLLQVVFHARMAEEEQLFTFDDVVEGITNKLIIRHPHIFGEDETTKTAEDVKIKWEQIKEEEREASGAMGLLDDVTLGLPALMRAEKLQKRAARVGFDWKEAEDVFDKLQEEISELQTALAHPSASGPEGREPVSEEIGDLLFTVANLARKLKVDPEEALRKANSKFERRFRFIEQEAQGNSRTLAEMSLSEMDELWNRAKTNEGKSD